VTRGSSSLEAWQPRRVIGPAAVAASLLLLGLHQVVSGAVRQAEQQRHTLTQQDPARSLCLRVADPAQRDLCLSRLGRGSALQVAEDD
jgi:hypothetical protein